MNIQDFQKLIKSYPVQNEFSHFNQPVKPPFIVWTNNNETFKADDIIYHSHDTYTIELYSRIDAIKEEKRLEEFFNENNLIWEKTNQIWIDEDKVMMIDYEIG